MLARMDIISVNCPHTPATFHLLSARRLKLIRKEAYIVNTARGEVIDEDTLIKLLETGEIGGAGLDVFENEPQVPAELIALDNVVLVPHIGSATVETRAAMAQRVFDNLASFFKTGKLISQASA
jgi:glyoxylate reductase